MCGIVGRYRHEPAASEGPEFPRLVDALAHRGPDDATWWHEGRFTFGHRRLSIIGLASGRQPMATTDGRMVVTFNGEIYNYLELREELSSLGHRFETQSDTEVLLHGYRQWGLDLLPRLLGMFAFGLADCEHGDLILARDRFGEKPLLYLEQPDGVVFASELAPLSRVATSRALDVEALGRYLCLNYVPGDATLFAGVRRVPPGGWRRYRADGRVDAGTWWAPPPADDVREMSEGDAVRELDVLLDRASTLALRSDVPVGIFLSAGIDSSLVARSAARAGRLERAFCLGFEEQDHSEVAGAQAAADRLGVPLTPVTLTPEALDHFFEIVGHADDPLADSSALAVWTLAREASRHVKVVLSGDGGDELFGGYLTHRATLWHQAATARLPMAIRRLLASGAQALPTGEAKVATSYKLMRYFRAAPYPPGQAHFSWNGTWLPPDAAHLVDEGAARAAAGGALAWMADRHGLSGAVDLARLQRADVADYLANDILVKSDRMSMAHGLEVRAPFLDRALAEFALRLPARLKAGLLGHGKRLLRRLAQESYGVDLARAKKQGFSIPVHTWLRGPGRSLVDDLLSPTSLASVPPLHAGAVTRVVTDHLSGRRSYGWELWGLMVLVAWHRRHIQRAPPWPPPSSRPPERITLPQPAPGPVG